MADYLTRGGIAVRCDRPDLASDAERASEARELLCAACRSRPERRTHLRIAEESAAQELTGLEKRIYPYVLSRWCNTQVSEKLGLALERVREARARIDEVLVREYDRQRTRLKEYEYERRLAR